jgi:2-polyprenyl-3-methyl-5-hydroxy-6-metoxy-1,4-benzoquinol methylase
MSAPSPSRNVPCNHCQADDFRVVFAAGVAQVNRIVRCNRCGLMYANPRRSADLDELEAAPPDAEGAPFAERNPQRFEKEQVQLRDHRRTRAFLARAHPGRGRLLELGSSLGFLLDAFRRDGWDVLGVDPDRAACRHASERLGLRTEGTTLERAALPSGAFDAVVALHVIEHVPDPVGTLREIHRILRPGGHLVLETPRYDSLMFRLLRHRERSVSCDGHIFFFTVETLRDGYRAAGFELERLEFPPRSLTLDRLAYNLAVMSKSEGVKRAARRLSDLPLAHGVRLTLNARDMQRVYLRKPGAPPAAA